MPRLRPLLDALEVERRDGATLAVGTLVGLLLSRLLPRSRGKALEVAGEGGASPASAKKRSTVQAPQGVELKMVLCVRSDLNMSAGKVGAQCAHAAWTMRSKLAKSSVLLKRWADQGQKKVALNCPNAETMAKLAAQARKLDLPCTIVRDAGRTEVAAGSATVLAIGPAPSLRVDEVTGTLRLL